MLPGALFLLGAFLVFAATEPAAAEEAGHWTYCIVEAPGRTAITIGAVVADERSAAAMEREIVAAADAEGVVLVAQCPLAKADRAAVEADRRDAIRFNDWLGQRIVPFGRLVPGLDLDGLDLADVGIE